MIDERAIAADAPPKDPLLRVRAIVFWVLAGELSLLLVSGVALFFVYRPSAAAAWADAGFLDRSSARLADVWRTTHRVTAHLTVPTAIAAGALVGIRRGTERRAAGLAHGIGIGVIAVLLLFTGYLLPWDQLGLRAVTVGTNISGYQPLLDDEVRFVIIGSSQVSVSTVVRWLVTHMLVLGPLLIGLVGSAWWQFVKPAPPPPNPPIVPPQY